MTAVLAALVLTVAAISAIHTQSVFAIDQSGTATASDDSSNTQTATNTPTASSSASGNGNGNGNGGGGDSGNLNGNSAAYAESHQSVSHHTSAKVTQKASCDNKGNSGISGNTC